MILKLKHILNQSYPFDYDFEKILKSAAGCGIFVFLFLYIFDPFSKQTDLGAFVNIIVMAGYGLITFFILFFAGLIFISFIPSVFNEDNWKVKNEIIASMLILILIGLANAFYSVLTNMQRLSFELFLQFQLYTFGIGIFPTLFFVIMEHYWLLKKNLKSAQQIRDKLTNHLATDNDNQKQDELLLTSDNEKEKLKIKSDNLFFIKSVGNYIEVYFKKDNTIDSRILRSSLKRVEDYLQGNRNFCRSHRAYLVNLNNIVNISGNSQGYELEFRELDKRVPVSRKYSKNLRDIII